MRKHTVVIALRGGAISFNDLNASVVALNSLNILWNQSITSFQRFDCRSTSAAALSGETRSRVIDENPPHQDRSHTKEMGPVAPVDMPLIDQSKVGLVDERGWLQ